MLFVFFNKNLYRVMNKCSLLCSAGWQVLQFDGRTDLRGVSSCVSLSLTSSPINRDILVDTHHINQCYMFCMVRVVPATSSRAGNSGGLRCSEISTIVSLQSPPVLKPNELTPYPLRNSFCYPHHRDHGHIWLSTLSPLILLYSTISHHGNY